MRSLRLKTIDRSFFFVLMLCAGFLLSLIRYAMRTNQIPEWDDQHFMHMATTFYRMLQDPSLTIFYDMVRVIPFRQPGYSLFILPFLFLFGLSHAYFWGIVTSGLFHVASIIGVYLLARVYLSKTASLLAAVLFTAYGWPLFYVHSTYSETATTAFCVWSIYSLTRSNYFQHKTYSLLFGVLLGLGFLTRWVTFIFVLGPLIYTFYHLVKKKTLRKKTVFLHILFAISIVFLLSFFPYIVNFFSVFDYVTEHRVGGPIWDILNESDRSLFSLKSLTFYLRAFAQLGIWYFILIIIGCLLGLKKKKLPIILVAIGVPWFFFSVLTILKADRFIIPIYPYLAILSALVFDEIKQQRLRLGLIVFTILLSCISFAGSVWGKGPMKQTLVAPFGQSVPIYLTTIAKPPDIYKKSGKEIVFYLQDNSHAKNINDPFVVQLFSYRPLDQQIYTYNLYHLEKPLQITNFVGTIVRTEKEKEQLVKDLLRADYILIKTGKTTDTYFPEENYTTLKSLIKFFSNQKILMSYFEKQKTFWIFQDSSEVIVFEKKKEIQKEIQEDLEKQLVKLRKT